MYAVDLDTLHFVDTLDSQLIHALITIDTF